MSLLDPPDTRCRHADIPLYNADVEEACDPDPVRELKDALRAADA